MRYIPNSAADRAHMLREIGVASLEELLAPIPSALRLKRPLALAPGKSEQEVVRYMLHLADKNKDAGHLTSFLGAGSYDHYVPAAVSAIAARSEFLTAYTPYQPEVAQGTLQVIYEFQSMICELFAMQAANASVYDGGSALAEALLLAAAHTGRCKVLWPDTVHPHYRKVAKTIACPAGITAEVLGTQDGRTSLADWRARLTPDVAAVVVQYPNFFGVVEPIAPLIQAAHDAGALAVVVADPIAMGVLEPPGNFGADIVVGEGQALGNPQSYGGPYLGLFATTDKLVRRMPGRIAGVTRDADGRRGFVLTLQTREQHIRRDKATSNICTNEGLCATRATIFLSLVGPQGLRQIGERCLRACRYLRTALGALPGITLLHSGPHFKEFAFRLRGDIARFLEFMANRGILAGIPLARFREGLDDALLVAVTERRTKDELDRYVASTRAFLEESAS